MRRRVTCTAKLSCRVCPRVRGLGVAVATPGVRQSTVAAGSASAAHRGSPTSLVPVARACASVPKSAPSPSVDSGRVSGGVPVHVRAVAGTLPHRARSSVRTTVLAATRRPPRASTTQPRERHDRTRCIIVRLSLYRASRPEIQSRAGACYARVKTLDLQRASLSCLQSPQLV